MKQKAAPSTNLEQLHKLLESKFDSLEKQIKEIEHNQKITDQKIAHVDKNLEFRIMAEAASTRQNIEQTLKAEIQVANSELRSELKNDFSKKLDVLETRLNKRLTHIADLITIQFGNKIQNHEKRIKKLEVVSNAG